MTPCSEFGDVEEQLLYWRSLYKREMQAALRCQTKEEKKALVQRWNRDYPKGLAENLLKFAKSEAAKDIAKWTFG